MYSDYLRRKSHDAIKFGYSDGYPNKVGSNNKGKDLKNYQIEGNSVQKNKNILPYPYYGNLPLTNNGITFTDNHDGTITANGTCTATTYYKFMSEAQTKSTLKAGIKYTLSGCPAQPEGTNSWSLMWNTLGFDKGAGYTYTWKGTETSASIHIQIITGAVCDNVVFKLQLEEGSTKTDYVSQVPRYNNPITVESIGEKTPNILPYPYKIQGSSVLNDISINESNGIINLNGTSSAFTSIPVTDGTSYNLTPGRYWLSGCPTGGNTSSYYLYCNVLKYSSDYSSYTLVSTFSDTGTGVELDLSNLDYNGIVIGIGIKEEATVNNLEFKPMIQTYSGDEVVSYEPASKYKLPVVVSSKNLLPYPYYSKTGTVNGITFTDNGDGTVTANGTATGTVSFICQYRSGISYPVGQYTLSGCPEGGSSTTYRLFWDTIGFEYGSGLSAPNPNHAIMINIIKGTTCNNLVFKPQLERGSAPTSYERYHAPVTSNIYLSEPLRGAGGKSDVIDFRSKSVVRNVKEVTINSQSTSMGAYNYDLPAGGRYVGVAFARVLDGNYSRVKGLCTHDWNFDVRYGIFPQVWLGVTNNYIYWVGILDSLGITTIDEFKEWLSEQETLGNPLKFYYPSNRESTESINLPDLPTFKGITTIYEIDSKVLPSNMKVKYIRV